MASGISFISGGLKKTAEAEAAESKGGAEPAEEGDHVDPLLQEQFGRPKPSKRRQPQGLKKINSGQGKEYVD